MPPPEGRKFVFQPVLKRYHTLYKDVVTVGDYAGEVLQQERFKTFTTAAMSVLDLPDSVTATVEAVLSVYYGHTLSDPVLKTMCWRLAAGHNLIKQGIPVLPELKMTPAEWYPFMIEGVRPAAPSKKGNAQIGLTLRFLGGTYAGITANVIMAHKYATRVFAKTIGFPRYEGVNHNELGQCWFVGLVEILDPRYPKLTEFHPTSVSSEHNRDLRKVRGEPCMRGYQWPCHKCTVGFDDTNPCPRACHKWNFVKKPCPACGNEEAFFDPGTDSQVCVGCNARKLRARLQVQR